MTGHYEIAGIGNVSGKNSTVTARVSNYYRIVQHELGHNVGITGHCDNSTQKCVMKSSLSHTNFEYNKWCGSCMLTILRFRAGI